MPILNPNAFTGNPLDRLSEKRGDEDWVAAHLADPAGRMAVFHKGRPLIAADGATPAWLSPSLTAQMPREAPHILLGFLDGIPYSALDASAAPPEAFSDHGEWQSLRETGPALTRADLAILGQAAWLLDWHRRHQFCARTGRRTQMRGGGVKRVEPESGTEHFPRVDPVAIVLPVHEDHCLVARSPHFPATLYSALAGFLEPGETLEECAIREIREEVGVTLEEVDYIFSQPWPFPSSLMVGFIGMAGSRELTLDPAEIEAARWVSRDEMAAVLAGEQGDFRVPPPQAIARRLIEHWLR